MALVDDLIDQLPTGQTIDQELDALPGGEELEAGLYPFHPIQEQHPRVSFGDRFAIMSAGGGGEGGARMLREEGLEVEHRGGMHFSVREEGGPWMVVDPERMDWQDFPDLVGDLGSIYAMIKGGTGGAVAGTALGGPVGGVVGGLLGAAGASAGAQVVRGGVGAAAGVTPTGEEFVRDIGEEAKGGAIAEAGGQILGAGFKLGRRAFGKAAGRDLKVTTRQAEVLTSMTDDELHAAAQMQKAKWTEVRAGRPAVPLEEGRRSVVQGVVGVLRYTKEMFDEKVGRELFPRIYKAILRESKQSGEDALRVAERQLINMTGKSRRRASELYAKLAPAGTSSTQEQFNAALTALSRHAPLSMKMHMVRRLAAVWGEDIAGLNYRESSYLLRRRMIDDDFLYREAARKSGVTDAFRKDVAGDFTRDLQGLVRDTYRVREATKAIQGAGPQELITATTDVGAPRYYTKEPPFSTYEAERARTMAPFERGERYRGEGRALFTGKRLPRPKPGDKKRVRFEKDVQEFELAEEIYRSRVFGQVPEATKATGMLPEPLVSLQRLERQVNERMFPRYPKGFKGPKPGFAPGAEGFQGLMPREEYVKFWEFLPIERVKGLRIGGKQIILTEPQSAVVKQAIVVMMIEPGNKWLGRMLTRVAGVLRLPRKALKGTLEAIGMSEVGRYLAERPARALLGGGAYAYAGGPAAGIVGKVVAADVIGGVLGKAGRYLMRDVSGETVKRAVQIAVQSGNGRAADVLTRAANSLEQFGESAYRAMIWEGLHDPRVREIIEQLGPEKTPVPEE